MDDPEKQRLAESFRALIEKLSREQDALYSRMTAVEEALGDVNSAWERMGLGPSPKPLGKPHPCGWVVPEHHEIAGDGMTPYIRAILRANADSPMSPTDVRNVLGEAGFDLTERANVMAEIHTVLKRLKSKSSQRIVTREVPEKGVCYMFSPTATGAAKQ